MVKTRKTLNILRCFFSIYIFFSWETQNLDLFKNERYSISQNILTSFLLKYEIDNDLYQPYNDSDNILNITEEIAKLHAALVGNIPPHVLCEIIINFVQKFKIWKEQAHWNYHKGE